MYCSGLFRPYLNLTNVLKELTIHTLISSDIDMNVSETWVRNDFIQSSFVLDGSVDVSHFNTYLELAWPGWNLRIPAGHYEPLSVYQFQ